MTDDGHTITLDGPGYAPCPAHREGLQLLPFTRALDIAVACEACLTWKAAA